MDMSCSPTLSPHHPSYLFDFSYTIKFLSLFFLSSMYLYPIYLHFLSFILHGRCFVSHAFPDADTAHAPPVLFLRYSPPPLYLTYWQYTQFLLALACVRQLSQCPRTPLHPCLWLDQLDIIILSFVLCLPPSSRFGTSYLFSRTST